MGGMAEIAIGAVLALFGAILAIEGWLLRNVWDAKADRLEVEARPTRSEVERMIDVAMQAWHKLDNEADERRLAPLAAEFQSAERHRNEQHKENREALASLGNKIETIDRDIKSLIGQRDWKTHP